jgi:hypothetical protein
MTPLPYIHSTNPEVEPAGSKPCELPSTVTPKSAGRRTPHGGTVSHYIPWAARLSHGGTVIHGSTAAPESVYAAHDGHARVQVVCVEGRAKGGGGQAPGI